jgi:tRNA (guanine-N7-)-methyltransferase
VIQNLQSFKSKIKLEMAKKKLKQYSELSSFPHVFQTPFNEVMGRDYYMKGKWHRTFFNNENPIVLELGCGKGEYAVGLAEKYPDKNFIGIDIKGARIWRGAKTSLERGMKNIAFIRTKVDFINSIFDKDEVCEIWITFPDPQEGKSKKRLTSARFLNSYKKLLKPDGMIHLKTDSELLYEFTSEIIKKNGLPLILATNDLYNSFPNDEILSIKTFYENQFLEKGLKITYIKFSLLNSSTIENPADDI